MIWLWRIFFSALSAAGLAAATLTVQVALFDSREPSVRKQKDYSGVALWLEPARGPSPPSPPKTYTLAQKGKTFVPHVLVVPVGSTVDFPNQDPIFHNAFSNFAGQPFDTGLYAPGTSRKVIFRREGVVRVFCNIHSSMSAVLVVVGTPWHAVSDASGYLRIAGLPEGEYNLRIWHERASPATLKALERRVMIHGDAQLPVIRISETGYLEVPHANKYGHPYPPEAPDQALYPGGRK